MADAYLKNNETGAIITRYLQYETTHETNLIHAEALDGTHYIQVIGSGSDGIKATAYVQRAGKTLLERAMQNGTMLSFYAHDIAAHGRIIALSFSDRMAGGWFRASVEAAAEEPTDS